jgi:transcriptional regulator with XRE-family HTH domain
MRNQLLLYLRKFKGFSRKSIARKIGISFSKYKQIETGESLMSKKVAKRLNHLYKMGKAPYILDAARQLEVLHMRYAIIRDLRQAKEDLLRKIDRINKQKQSASKRSSTRK